MQITRSRLFACSLSLLALLCASSVSAQDPDKDVRSSFGLDVAVAIPVDDWADVSDVSLGGLVRFEHRVIPQLAITGRAGYMHDIVDQDGFALGHVPLLAGARYYILEGDSTPWVGAELGLAIWWAHVTVDTGFGSASDSDTEVELALALSGGYRAGAFNFGAGLYVPSADEAFGFHLTAGFDFAQF